MTNESRPARAEGAETPRVYTSKGGRRYALWSELLKCETARKVIQDYARRARASSTEGKS